MSFSSLVPGLRNAAALATVVSKSNFVLKGISGHSSVGGTVDGVGASSKTLSVALGIGEGDLVLALRGLCVPAGFFKHRAR